MSISTTPLEQKLLEQGYSSLSLTEKNSLITILASREGVTFSMITDDYILNHHKSLKKALIDDNKAEDIATGFTSTNGHFYTVTTDDQINFLGQKAILDLDPTITEVLWEQVDLGQWVSHTKDEWLTVFKEAFTYKRNCMMQCNILKGEITAATDEDTVFNTNWVNPGLTTPTVPTPTA